MFWVNQHFFVFKKVSDQHKNNKRLLQIYYYLHIYCRLHEDITVIIAYSTYTIYIYMFRGHDDRLGQLLDRYLLE